MWSAKGGVGTSVTAAATALQASRDHGEALLVDLGGDQTSILGLATTNPTGLFDWLGSKADRRESIERLSVPTSLGLHVVPPGTDRGWDTRRVDQLVEVLGSFDCPVIIDCGVRTTVGGVPDSGGETSAHGLVEALCSSARSVLVSSSCYLAVRRAVQVLGTDGGDRDGLSGSATGLVVVADPGRALAASDVASVTQLDLLADLERDPAVARCVDAGQFLLRPPRSLLRALRGVL